MKIISFNINGLRARPHQLEALIETHQPDVIGLQEIKVADEQFPHEMISSLGYHVEHHGQKGHYGVALLSKQLPENVIKGFPNDDEDAQRRFIRADYRDSNGQVITVMNGYFPQGENRKHETKFSGKVKFYADLQNLLETTYNPQDALVVMGDFNIAPEDSDIGIGPDNAKRWLRTGKCCFLPEEREWMQRLKDWGLVDSFRHMHPDTDNLFSWFDYRSKGFDDTPKRGLRIDMVMASSALVPHFADSGIDYELRSMEKPSDHAPIWLTLKPR